MWMRSCAVCKALLRKAQLWISVRCECGWEWQASGDEPSLNHGDIKRTNLAVRPMPNTVEFYVPSTFRTQETRTPTNQSGKLIEFLSAKKSA